jgi:hypothetical protein
MKTFYLIKSFLPFTFLPIAPGVVQIELVRQGLLTDGSSILLAVLMQIAFTIGIIAWLACRANRTDDASAFLKMSCVSKKVCHRGQWMTFEKYLADHHNIIVSHGMTPEESEAWVRDSEEWLREAKEVSLFDGMNIPCEQNREAVLAK